VGVGGAARKSLITKHLHRGLRSKFRANRAKIFFEKSYAIPLTVGGFSGSLYYMKIEMKNEIGGNKSYGSVKVGNIKFYIHELWGGKFRVYARGGSFKPNSGKGSWTLPDMLAVEKLIAKFEVSP